MIDNSFAPSLYNRFSHLDEVEDRLIYYLISMNNKNEDEIHQTEIIWKLLFYGSDYDALNKELPNYNQIRALISDDGATESQSTKRIFRSPHFEDAWLEQSTLLKIYIDSIIPVDRYKSIVNIGIDIITHNKCVNIAVNESDIDEGKIVPIDYIDGDKTKPVYIQTKSRVSTLAKAIVSLLNGANVEGVGQLEFAQTMSRFQQAQYGVWNNRNFEGIKLVMGCYMSGVS